MYWCQSDSRFLLCCVIFKSAWRPQLPSSISVSVPPSLSLSLTDTNTDAHSQSSAGKGTNMILSIGVLFYSSSFSGSVSGPHQNIIYNK